MFGGMWELILREEKVEDFNPLGMKYVACPKAVVRLAKWMPYIPFLNGQKVLPATAKQRQAHICRKRHFIYTLLSALISSP